MLGRHEAWEGKQCLFCFLYHHGESRRNCKDKSFRPDVFCKKGVLKNFAKFTGKQLFQSLFFNKVAGLRPFFYGIPPVAASVKTLSLQSYN